MNMDAIGSIISVSPSAPRVEDPALLFEAPRTASLSASSPPEEAVFAADDSPENAGLSPGASRRQRLEESVQAQANLAFDQDLAASEFAALCSPAVVGRSSLRASTARRASIQTPSREHGSADALLTFAKLTGLSLGGIAALPQTTYRLPLGLWVPADNSIPQSPPGLVRDIHSVLHYIIDLDSYIDDDIAVLKPGQTGLDAFYMIQEQLEKQWEQNPLFHSFITS